MATFLLLEAGVLELVRACEAEISILSNVTQCSMRCCSFQEVVHKAAAMEKFSVRVKRTASLRS